MWLGLIVSLHQGGQIGKFGMKEQVFKVPAELWLIILMVSLALGLVTSTISLAMALSHLLLYPTALLSSWLYPWFRTPKRDYTLKAYVAFVLVAIFCFPAAIEMKSVALYASGLFGISFMPFVMVMQNEEKLDSVDKAVEKVESMSFREDESWTTPWKAPVRRYIK